MWCELASSLCCLFKCCFLRGVFPSQRKVTSVTPVQECLSGWLHWPCTRPQTTCLCAAVNLPASHTHTLDRSFLPSADLMWNDDFGPLKQGAVGDSWPPLINRSAAVNSMIGWAQFLTGFCLLLHQSMLLWLWFFCIRCVYACVCMLVY